MLLLFIIPLSRRSVGADLFSVSACVPAANMSPRGAANGPVSSADSEQMFG